MQNENKLQKIQEPLSSRGSMSDDSDQLIEMHDMTNMKLSPTNQMQAKAGDPGAPRLMIQI